MLNTEYVKSKPESIASFAGAANTLAENICEYDPTDELTFLRATLLSVR